jgi:aldose 1-epimerase
MDSIDTYELKQGTSFKIAPDWGCNMFSWVVGGKELIYCPEDLPATAKKITGGGNPLLFPSVGRTWDRSSGEPVQGSYRIYGHDKTYFMPSHGILFLSQWHKSDESRDADSITAIYDLTIPDKVKEENYPFDVAFSHKFTLKPESVELEATITNVGDTPAPVAFGYHPYFKISNPQREGVEVRLPVTKHLMLTKDTVLLTGESEDTNGVVQLQPDIYYDNAFSNPTGTRMSLIDRRAGHTIHVDFDEKLELFFLYSPDDSDFVCIEPWTRGLGAYEYLRNPGWESGELIPVLQPGEVVKYGAAFVYERG